LGVDTKITLLAAGLIFLVALVLGVWKYRQIMVADDHRAHPYVDIAHRAALLYSFATLLLAAFVELSAWPAWVNLTAAMIVVFFFVAAILGYISHGVRRDTVNQFESPIGRCGWRWCC
jgi:preprotein translocase subunit SecG